MIHLCHGMRGINDVVGESIIILFVISSWLWN